MLLEELIVCAFIGMATAGVISLFVTKGKADAIVLLMMLFGTTIGWVLGMIFIFTTGGLELTVEWFVLPVLTTAFLSFFVLRKYRNMKFIRFSKKEKTNKSTLVVSILIVVALLGSVVVMALPATYDSSYATDSLSLDGGKILSTRRAYELSGSDADALSVPLSSGLSIDTSKSSVDFPRIAEDPTEGDYLEFQATFSVSASGGDWTQPFIKMTVVSDEDNSGTLTAGDLYWYDSNFKFATESGKNWRTNLMYETEAPVMQLHQVILAGSEMLILPIFHANAITQWMNDNGQTFANTPELYVSPLDQMSWQLSGGSVSLMEDITTFASIPVGSSESIQGKIHCPADSAGQHFLIIQAFDMYYHDPFEPTETPFAQELMIFVVLDDGGYCGDGVCIPPEDEYNCPEDCEPGGSYCGDGTCDEGENQYNCPEDCGYPSQPDIDITTSAWVVTIALLMLTGIGGIGAVVYAPKLLFGKGGKKL